MEIFVDYLKVAREELLWGGGRGGRAGRCFPPSFSASCQGPHPGPGQSSPHKFMVSFQFVP